MARHQVVDKRNGRQVWTVVLTVQSVDADVQKYVVFQCADQQGISNALPTRI
jgi:hypothetical protein